MSWHSTSVLVYPHPRGDLKIAKTWLSNQPNLNGDSITILQHTASTWCSLINNLAPCPHKKTCIIKWVDWHELDMTWQLGTMHFSPEQLAWHNRMCWPTTDCSFLTASIRCFLINILAPYISHQQDLHHLWSTRVAEIMSRGVRNNWFSAHNCKWI